MGPTEIGLLILGGVSLMAIFAFVAQNIENTRRERQLRIMALKDSVRRAHHLLTSYPPVFMTLEIKKLLGTYLEQKWDAIYALDNSEESQKQIARAQAIKTEVIEPVPHTPGSLTVFPDPMSAQRARSAIEEFSRFLADAERKHEIHSKIRKGYQKQLQIAQTRAKFDADIFEALQIEAIASSEAALPKMRNAFNNLENISKQHNLQNMDRQIYELRTYVDNMIQTKKTAEAARIAERDRQLAEELKQDPMKF